MPRRPPYARYLREDTRVAGVTFDNEPEDGGESRQVLLQRLAGMPTIVTLERSIFHRESTGLDERAIKVRSKITGKVIGYIPKTQVEQYWDVPAMIAQVRGKDVLSCVLTLPEPPSQKQYRLVSLLQSRGIMRFRPVYDKTVYQYVLEKYLPNLALATE